MWNAPEVVREVGVNDFRVATEQLRFHLDHRLLGISPGTVGILLWRKIGFKDRFQHQHRCRHADPITQGRDAQWPEFAIGLRYVHSSDRVRSIRLLPERKRQFTKPPLHPAGRTTSLINPAISAFPERVVGSADTDPMQGAGGGKWLS